MTDKKLEIREQILDILRNGKKAGYAPHRPSQLEQTRLKQADLILDLLKAERNRVLDELKQRFLMYTAKHDQAMRDEVLGVIKKIRRDE